MKQFLTVVAVGVFGAFVLVACGGKDKPAESPAGTETAPAGTDTAAPTGTDTAAPAGTDTAAPAASPAST